jgi:hypothetical protein
MRRMSYEYEHENEWTLRSFLNDTLSATTAVLTDDFELTSTSYVGNDSEEVEGRALLGAGSLRRVARVLLMRLEFGNMIGRRFEHRVFQQWWSLCGCRLAFFRNRMDRQ